MTTSPKTPKQLAATLARTKDPAKAHDLYRALLQALPSGTSVLPLLPRK